MEIKIATEKDKEIWDETVYTSSNGTIFHTWKWLKIMEKHSSNKILKRYNNVLYPIMVTKGEDLVGLIPLYFTTSPLMKIVSSPPRGVENLYLGPVINNFENLKPNKRESRVILFQREIDKFIRNEFNPNFILLNSCPGLQESRPFRWSGYTVEPRYTYVIDLKIGQDKIWGDFSKSLRKDIEKAKNAGIKMEEGSIKDVEYIYDLLKSRKRMNSSKEFINEIFENFYPQYLKVFIVKKGDEIFSGEIVICYKNKACIWIGAPKSSYKGRGLNELMEWETIKWAIDNGFDSIEIMGADDYWTCPFKIQFGGELVPFLSMRWYSPMLRLLEAAFHIIKPKSKYQNHAKNKNQ